LWRTFADPNQLRRILNSPSTPAIHARWRQADDRDLESYLDQAYIGSLSEPVEPGQYVMIAVAARASEWIADARATSTPFSQPRVGKGTGLGLSQGLWIRPPTGGTVKILAN